MGTLDWGQRKAGKGVSETVASSCRRAVTRQRQKGQGESSIYQAWEVRWSAGGGGRERVGRSRTELG